MWWAHFLAFESAWVGGFAAASAQCSVERLTPPEPWWRADYGARVAMAANRLIIADPRDAWACPVLQDCSAGAVHSYSLDAASSSWIFQQSLRPADIGWGYGFGSSVAVDGNRMIVGAPFSDLVEASAGAAYVFEAEEDRWVETAQIGPARPRFLGEFGSAVEIQGDLALIRETWSGSVSVYQKTAPGWALHAELKAPDDPPRGSAFGAAIALAETWLFIGAPFDASVATQGGAVYVYRREAGGLTFTQKLVPPDVDSGPRFGFTIAHEASTLAIGGYISDRVTEGQGAIYIYELDGAQWVLRQEVTHDDPLGSDRLGSSLSLACDTIVAGAPTHGAYGQTYVFRRAPSGKWSQAARLDPGRATGPFGEAVATDGRCAVVGAPDETVGPVEFTGAAYIFDLDCLLACPADLDGDGELTFFDFLAFGNLFAAGDLRADFDGSGVLDLFDFLAFQTAFAAGC